MVHITERMEAYPKGHKLYNKYFAIHMEPYEKAIPTLEKNMNIKKDLT